MNTIYRLTTLFALTLAALGADVKFSALPTATSPSTNSYLPIIDLDLLPAAQNQKYLLTNLANATPAGITNALGYVPVNKAGDTSTGSQGYSGTTIAGVKLNNLTTVQRDALTGAETNAGSLLWNTTQTRLNVHNGSAWTDGFVRLAGDTMTGALSLPAGSKTATSLNSGTANTGIYFPGGTGLGLSISGTTYLRAEDSNTGMELHANWPLAWSSAAADAAPDLKVYRDAPNTLALRNGANAQTFNVYNTYTDASNYERLSQFWSGNTMFLQNQAAGTGTQRKISIDGLTIGLYAANGEIFRVTTSGLIFPADNTYDIGASGANRPRWVYTVNLKANNIAGFAGGQFYNPSTTRWDVLDNTSAPADLGVKSLIATTSIQGGYTKVCTSAVSNALFYVSVPNTNMIGGRVLYTVNSTDGTDAQQITGTLQFGAVGKATAVTANVTDVQNTSTVSAGTLTATLTANVSTNNVFALMVTPTTSLTTTNLTVKWRLETPSTYTVNPL